MKKVIATKNAPAAIGPYSQAVQVGNMLFASGQLGIDPATGLFVEGSVKEQTAQAFKNVHAILAEAGYSINDERIIIRNNESSLIACRDYSRYPSRLLP